MKKFLFLILVTAFCKMAYSQQVIPLYKGEIPNARPVKDEEVSEPQNEPGRISLSHVTRPTLAIYLPPKEKANGTAVIVCPGGSYSHLAMTHEGIEVAQRLNEMGVAAFVLKYRLPDDRAMVHKEIAPLQDAQRAIQLVREQAAAWGIDPGRVGIMGFSAGGHLASTAGTHFNKVQIDNKDNISLRPDFMILLYPVISFDDSIAHQGSRNNLIGPHLDAAAILEYSNERQITPQTPPCFLVHTEDDDVVPVANSLRFYEALLHNKVPAEMHVYPKGGHGFGMHNPTTKDEWIERLRNWLDANGWLKK